MTATGAANKSWDYLRDPKAIYARSFAIIRAEADLSRFSGDSASIAERMIHACGQPDIVADLRMSSDFPARARAALARGRPVLTDCEMVQAALSRRALAALGNPVHCFLNDPQAAAISREKITTRSAAAVELWRPLLAGALVIIGNAPTSLFRLLELLADGFDPPAAIIATPVGFVGAEESKAALHEAGGGAAYVTLLGRRGGSALAAAAFNAVALRLP